MTEIALMRGVRDVPSQIFLFLPRHRRPVNHVQSRGVIRGPAPHGAHAYGCGRLDDSSHGADLKSLIGDNYTPARKYNGPLVQSTALLGKGLLWCSLASTIAPPFHRRCGSGL